MNVFLTFSLWLVEPLLKNRDTEYQVIEWYWAIPVMIQSAGYSRLPAKPVRAFGLRYCPFTNGSHSLIPNVKSFYKYCRV